MRWNIKEWGRILFLMASFTEYEFLQNIFAICKALRAQATAEFQTKFSWYSQMFLLRFEFFKRNFCKSNNLREYLIGIHI